MGNLVSIHSKQTNYAKLNADILKNPDYGKLAKSIFLQSIDEFNGGKIQKSLETAMEALMYAKYSRHYIRVYIHSFLALLNFENRRLNVAKIHCWQGLELLQKGHRNYKADFAYLTQLQNEIEENMPKTRKSRKRERTGSIAC